MIFIASPPWDFRKRHDFQLAGAIIQYLVVLSRPEHKIQYVPFPTGKVTFSAGTKPSFPLKGKFQNPSFFQRKI
jgi:hypothetical protein